MATFLDQCEALGRPVPEFVKKEFEAYLRCGILAHGFARVYCADCRYDRLVAFSCKKRGFCGSCMARRMSETAAYLVEAVVPEIPTRQWVLSVPAPLRFLIAYDNEALKVVLDAFIKTVSSWLRKKAKEDGAASQRQRAYAGAVTFIQRFGSALNLNTHMHTVFSDGVFVENASGFVTFHRTPAPTLEEIRAITEKIVRKVHRWLEKQAEEAGDAETFAEKEPLLAACYGASIRYLTALGSQAWQPLMRVFSTPPEGKSDRDERTVAGFNLHVSIPIEAHDRRGLERQLRYMGRPPLSEERLTKTADGRIVVRLKSAWGDGTTHQILQPLEFIERLVALVPPPRKNQVRYHGVFAPNASLREEIVPTPESGEPQPKTAPVEAAKPGHPTRKRLGWAKLMARVFGIDVIECPRCKSKLQVLSFITEPDVIKNILKSLGMATAPPEMARSGFKSEQTDFVYDYDYAQ